MENSLVLVEDRHVAGISHVSWLMLRILALEKGDRH